MTLRIIKNISVAAIMSAVIFSGYEAEAYRIGETDIKMIGEVDELYDDNVTYSKDNKKFDFVTGLEAGVDIKYESKRGKLGLAGNIKQHFFADNPGYNNLSENATLTFDKSFSKKDRISVDDAFLHAEEPRSFEDELGRGGGRYSYYQNRFNLLYEHDFTRQISYSLRYRNDIDAYSRDDIFDSMVNSGGTAVRYYVSSADSISFSYDYLRRDFDTDDFVSVNTVAGGVTHYFFKNLYLYAGAGIDVIRTFNGKDIGRPRFSGVISGNPDKRSSLSLSFEQGYSSRPYALEMFDHWQISGDYKRRISEKMDLSLSGFFGRGKYSGLDIEDYLMGADIIFSYDLTRYITGIASYGYSRVDSNTRDREYAKNTVRIGLRLKY